MKIALVGEAPNDTKAIQNLLSKHYKGINFVSLIDKVNGSMLDNRKALHKYLKVEFELSNPNLVIFIRDLDSHEKDKVKIKERENAFSYSNNIIRNKGLFLLNIYELEALILADIDVFNKEYGCSIEKHPDPMKVKEPKEVLYTATHKLKKSFNVSHNPHLFNLLNFDRIKSNCRYFSTFIEDFNARLSELEN
jgi:hypothetical protein